MSSNIEPPSSHTGTHSPAPVVDWRQYWTTTRVGTRVSWWDSEHTPPTTSPEQETKPTVLFLHGWGLSPKAYEQCLAWMTPYSRVVAPTLPGFGDSDPLPESSHRRTQLTAYSDVIAESWGNAREAPQPVPIVGHSMGCGVAVRLAHHHPELVESLTLVCPIGGAGSGLTTWLSLAGSLVREVPHSFGLRLLDSAPALLRHPNAAARAALAAKTADLQHDLHLLLDAGVPITIIAAHDDGVVPPGPLRTVGGTFIEVSGGHGWLLHEPEEFAHLIQPHIQPHIHPRTSIRRD